MTRCAILSPDVLIRPVGGVKNGERLVGEDGLGLHGVHDAVNPDTREDGSVSPFEPKEYSFDRVLGASHVAVSRVHLLRRGRDHALVRPVKVTSNSFSSKKMKVLPRRASGGS